MNEISDRTFLWDRASTRKPHASRSMAAQGELHWLVLGLLGSLLFGSASVGLQAAQSPPAGAATETPHSTPATSAPLTLHEVLDSVRQQYPPMLAALIERDVAAGRLQSARGTFDFQFFSRLFDAPSGYYQSTTVDSGFEQFTGIWGSTLFGGYRITSGGLLPDYEKSRTQGSGEPRIGFRLPLLRDGSIDRRRATLIKARLDKELADPVIHRQQLDFIRAATAGYYGWLAAGERLRLSEALLRIARERMDALKTQSESGLIPRIVLTDNRRLIVSRELAVVQARRRFEAAGLALSLFHRDSRDNPTVATRDRLPPLLPTPEGPEASLLQQDLQRALTTRPELKRLSLTQEKLEVDRRLAKNQLLPNLDAGVSASRDYGDRRYKDQTEAEVQVGVELRVPLQRREAKGRVAEVDAQLEQVTREQQFARDRIQTEVRDSFSAWSAAHEQTVQARINVQLAVELQEAETERFARGASDLLALQLREQAAFDAQVSAVDIDADCFRAQADYRAATVAERLTVITPPKKP
jgi:cobalt-zinc-cadmium efflux system outer membrane protein